MATQKDIKQALKELKLITNININGNKVSQLSKELGVSTEQVLASYSEFAKVYTNENQIFETIETSIKFSNMAKM